MVWDKVQDAIEMNQPFQLNYRITTASGAEKWVWEQGQAIYGEEGDVISLEGFITDITERKNAEKKLRNSHNQLRSLAERLQMIREEERATVAREIHDDLGQALTALKMDIAWMKKNSGMTEEMRASKMDVMLRLTDSTIQTVKRIATELRPGILDDLGLVSAIEWQTKEFQNRSGIECNFEIFVDEFALEDDISIAVFRIFQESLTNIARHSGATKVTVTIKEAGDYLQVEITDNGVGISEKQISSSKSLGIIGMNERVSVFRGKLTISRAAEGGTAVRVYIPVGKV
jgi:signal transduction histidine kinase